VPIHYKGQWYFEMHEYTPIKEMEALIDREGKLAAATKAAEEAAKEVEVNGPKAPKKKATTKNAKKGKTTVQEASKPVSRHLPRLPGSSVSFFLNGEPLGEAFNGLYDFVPLPPIAPPTAKKHPALFDPQRDVLHDDGTLGYYPMISCFGRGKVRCNFGPEWVKPPRDLAARPMSERWDEFREEERILDEADETEAAVKIVKEEERVRAITQLETGGRKAKSSSKRKKGTATPTPAPDGFGDRDGTPRSDVLDGLPVKIEMESAAPTPRGSSRAGSVVSAGTVEVVLKDEKMESEEGVNWG
jgi:COMPASS component BRE2